MHGLGSALSGHQTTRFEKLLLALSQDVLEVLGRLLRKLGGQVQQLLPPTFQLPRSSKEGEENFSLRRASRDVSVAMLTCDKLQGKTV